MRYLLGVRAHLAERAVEITRFNGVRGYEVMGQLGFLIGAFAGAVLSGWGAFAVVLRMRNATHL